APRLAVPRTRPSLPSQTARLRSRHHRQALRLWSMRFLASTRQHQKSASEEIGASISMAWRWRGSLARIRRATRPDVLQAQAWHESEAQRCWDEHLRDIRLFMAEPD